MKLALFLLIIVINVKGVTQNQFHIGQYMINQSFINPAAMGSYNNINGGLFYKSQWTGLDGAPKIQGLNINFPLKNGKNFMGITIIHDKIAINDVTEFSLPYAYKLNTGEKSRLVFSLTTSLNILKSDFNQIDVLDSNDPVFTNGNPSVILPNFKYGMYYFRNNFYAGFAIPNILENKIIYTNKYEGKLTFNANNIHFYFQSGYSFKINNNIDLNTSFLFKEVSGAPVQFDFNTQIMYKNKFGLGSSYRTSKELLTMFNYQITNEIMLSYGYEMSFTELSGYNSGTHEIVLTFDLKNPLSPIIEIPRF